VLAALKKESESPSCDPVSLMRLCDVLSTDGHCFCGVLGFIVRLQPNRPVVVSRVVKFAKMVC
jgi:hypothetical protein